MCPYVYSHSAPITNYGHNNQSMGHQVAILRNLLPFNHQGRYFADMKIIAGTRGSILTLQEIAITMKHL
jgi:hypothetical protein